MLKVLKKCFNCCARKANKKIIHGMWLLIKSVNKTKDEVEQKRKKWQNNSIIQLRLCYTFAWFAICVKCSWINKPKIFTDENEPHQGDGRYRFEYLTGNGIAAQEEGYLNNPNAQEPEFPEQVAIGSYSYTAPDGQLISVSYTVGWKLLLDLI